MAATQQQQLELPDDHFRPTYDEIHVMIGESAQRIRAEFDPDLMVAIGGGGFCECCPFFAPSSIHALS